MEIEDENILKLLTKEYQEKKVKAISFQRMDNKIQCVPLGHLSLLQVAIYLDDTDFANQLIRTFKVDVNVISRFMGTALHVAVYKRSFAVIKELLKAGANVQQLHPIHHVTPIYWSLETSNFKENILIHLIMRGAAMDEPCKKFYSNAVDLKPLDVAIKNQNTMAVEILFQYGVKIDWERQEDRTRLQIARGNMAMELIIQKHLIKLHAANFRISDEELSVMTTWNLHQHCEECCEELKKMKRWEIDGLDINYYDLLTKKTEEIADVMLTRRNTEFGIKISVKRYFKHYEKLIIFRYNQALLRYKRIIEEE